LGSREQKEVKRGADEKVPLYEWGEKDGSEGLESEPQQHGGRKRGQKERPRTRKRRGKHGGMGG